MTSQVEIEHSSNVNDLDGASAEVVQGVGQGLQYSANNEVTHNVNTTFTAPIAATHGPPPDA